ncbi:monovalent cation/proton antiporter, MnhG/PhaG subunit [Staphylothermus marinus F1]|uniref:Monovalent cation/proton antiporter, MnhG/PhaG subunit n=1 Tax=Staphylothermus marinus (strain ATCC 43588 / DSM 3639 / JCM 9404 / F1) TaxID=399550 RepID=A3DM97_STAMF|nr:monovalent cation/H(+) antiporter subunit G [Staphylothermus marinus]ABN69757.1 monovalent cation/proton antiporter, MnhG/PhaG subunit [Staphylothermus marinus F1]
MDVGVVLEAIAYYVGLALILVGGVLDLIASIGMNRFRNFYLRLHAATIGAIGGGFYPLIGLGLIALTFDWLGNVKYYISGIAFTTAFFLVLTAPVGSHALAQGAHKSRIVMPEPIIADKLLEDEEREVGKQ